MKSNKAIIMLILLYSIIACQKKQQTIYEDKIKYIDFKIENKISITSQQQNTKITSKEIYAIQVEIKNENIYEPYAYGLFDNIQNLKIPLQQNEIFKIKTSSVENATEILATINNLYREPFIMRLTPAGTPITNSFILSQSKYFTGLNIGAARMIEAPNNAAKIYKRPNINRYYNQTQDLIINELNQIKITLKQVVFGIKLNVIGDNKYSSITVNIEDAKPLNVKQNEIETQKIYIYSFKGETGIDWSHDTYAEEITINVTIQTIQGTQENLGPITHLFQIGKYYTLNIDTDPSQQENVFTIDKQANQLIDGGEIDM